MANDLGMTIEVTDAEGHNYRGVFGIPTVGQIQQWQSADKAGDLELKHMLEVGASVIGFESFDDVPFDLAMAFLRVWAQELTSLGELQGRRIR